MTHAQGPRPAAVAIPDCCAADQPDAEYAVRPGDARVRCGHCLDDVFDVAEVPTDQLNRMEHLT